MGAKPLKKLNDKHILFIERYLSNGMNGAEAYRYAFKIDDLARSRKRGWDLLQDPLIKEEIKISQEELRNKYDIKKERIIKELVDIIDFNILDVQSLKKITELKQQINPLGELEEVEVERTVLETNLDNLTLEQQKNIKSIEMLKNGTVKITYYDRLDAMEKLNKLLGFYEQSVVFDTRIDTSALANLTFEQLQALMTSSKD